MHARSRSWVALLLAAAGASPCAGYGDGGDLVELEVAGVLPLESETGSLLVLRDKVAGTMLPIFVGRAEGTAIDQRLKHRTPGRHGRAELLERAIAALGGRVARVAIEGEQAALLHGRISLEQGERHLEIEGRPSDSVALAVAARAPIFATRQVLSDAGLTREDLGRMRRGRTAPPADGERGPKLSF